MRRLSAFLICFGLFVLGILLATGTPDHKIAWCHFPPGGWTGDATTSKYQLLSIDVAADGSLIDGQHLNHQGDGPESVLGTVCGTVSAQSGCGTALGDLVAADGSTIILQYPGPVQLVPGVKPFKGQCVCPPGSLDDGFPPGGNPLDCGSRH